MLLPALLWMLAGMFAGRIMRGRGYGPIADILLGLAGGIVGRWLFGLLGVSIGSGLIASLVVGTIGAVVLVGLGRVLNGNRQQLA
ncbi:MAG: GlsB/YeaQ/YmgE family stress response membrane protein [Anaerolineaceae bacterium]|nr:GlsB/YeaQ/YmgE family stress response membrane protein [Anaerolineaceae bacterium]